MRGLLLAVTLVASLLGTAGAVSAAPVVNGIYPVSDTPAKLTQGSDGNVWVVVGGVP